MDNGGQAAKVKMSGYLHLKKKRMMSSWKNYWCVLEDRLLLFYHSKAEYDAISPCKGSINLGPPCSIKSLPSVANGFQIETRSVTYSLRAENSDEQKKWMQIILSALNQNQNIPTEGAKRLSHFRYSLDDLIPEVEPNDSKVLQKVPFGRQNTLPNRKSKESSEIIQRLQKMGAQSYGGSLEVITKIATKKAASPPVPEIEAQEEEKSKMSEDRSKEGNLLRPNRVCGDNIYERISGDSQDSNRGSFLVDNENYSVPLRKSLAGMEGEASTVSPIRETKSLMVENDDYGVTRQVQSVEAIYAEPKVNEVTDCNKNSVVVENSYYASSNVAGRSEHLYEDLEFSHYSQPVFKSEESSSQSSTEVCKPSQVTKKEKLKKSRSFIKRVWRRKSKKKEKEVEEEEIYAEINVPPVEKVASVTDDNALQMLSELQSILENKKTQMKANVSSSPSPSNDHPESDKTHKPTSPAESASHCPLLPPKTHKEPKRRRQVEQVRSLDEILEDLDKEQVECKSKVQMLIERFSDGDVTLRKHEKSDLKNYRHSDDLNKLLDELAKVTSAPIMTPGVTSSLVNPNLTDEEWLKLLPVRQRRLSEPDYDVPRLHGSLQLPKSDPENSDAIPPTRFFGPVLNPITTDNKEESLPLSMTPDSLEMEAREKMEPDYSYISHIYNNHIDNLKSSQQDDKVIYAMPKSYLSVATHIVNTCQNICGAPMTEECTIVYKSVKNVDVQEEIFKDSLELCHETATEF